MVGIAVGTVLLPEMSRRIAAGDMRGAALAQARGIQLALLLTVPCVAGAIAIPDLIMRALFARGAFTEADAAAAGVTSPPTPSALPFVMLRSFTAPFYARGDTATPVKAALLAAAVNIALKVVLMGPLAQVGLAFHQRRGLDQSALLTIFAPARALPCRRGAPPGDQAARGGRVLAGRSILGNRLRPRLWPGLFFREETTLAILLLAGAIIYAIVVLALLGWGWLGHLFKEVDAAAAETPAKTLEQPSPEEASPRCPITSPRRRSRLRRERRSISSTSDASIGRPRKMAPTRAKRSGESVAKKRMLAPPTAFPWRRRREPRRPRRPWFRRNRRWRRSRR